MGLISMTFGIETFHPKAAINIGKSVKPDKIKDFLLKLKQDHPELHTSSGFIVGLPGEDRESILETNRWLLDTKALNSWQYCPLFLENLSLNEFSSVFSHEIEKHGYTREGKVGWRRPDMHFESAATLARELNRSNMYKINISAWYLFSLTDKNRIPQARHLFVEDFADLCTTNKLAYYKEKLFAHVGYHAPEIPVPISTQSEASLATQILSL
jgi:hypothetical protein